MTKSLFLILLFLVFSCEKQLDIKRQDAGVKLDIPLTGSLQNAAFSPDGKSIVFTRFLKGYNKEPAELYTYHLETEKLDLLVSDGSGNINLPGASWKNGLIIFASTRDPHDEIYSINPLDDNGSEIQITKRTNHVAYEPSLSPDAQWIVFESHLLDVETEGIITKYKLDGSSEYISLTASDKDARQPNWSPQNNKILYQQLSNNIWSIWTMNIDGSKKNKTTHNIGSCTDAAFSNDGQFIVFSTNYDTKIANIYKISLDGTQSERLTIYDGYDGAPSISPDGKKLIFESSSIDPDNSSGTSLILLDI